MKPAPSLSGRAIGSRMLLGMVWRIYWATVRL
jgi:hypothetical protein